MAGICPACDNPYEKVGLHWNRSPTCDYPEIEDRKFELLTGLMLGDASAVNPRGYTHVQVSMIRLAFLEWLYEELGWLASNSPSKKGEGIWTLRTRNHPQLDWYRSWYDSGKKRFPDNLSLTPTILKMWYVSDGCLDKGNVRPYIRIASTNESDRSEFLLRLFEDVGLEPKWWQNNFIAFGVDESLEVWDWMGDPVPGFEYKWPEVYHG